MPVKCAEHTTLKQKQEMPSQKIRNERLRKAFDVWTKSHFSNFEVR